MIQAGNQTQHLLGFYTALLASGATNVALGPVLDQAVISNTTSFFLGDDARVLAAYLQNDAFSDARVNSPSLRDPYLPHIDPLNVGTSPPNTPPIALYDDYGWTIPKNEFFALEASRTVTAASIAMGLLWLNFGRRPIPAGPRFPALFTAASTGAAGSWFLSTITFADNLPAGRYAVAGLAVYGANTLAARLVFQGGGYRPGVICQQAVGEYTGRGMPKDYQGMLGDFLNTTPPQLEVLGFGAVAAQTGVMDLVQIG